MPIYEYQCAACSAVFEVFQKHSDPPPAEHSCGSKEIRRLLSNTSFVLKGTGWYATDYGNKKNEGKKRGGDHDAKRDGDKPADGKNSAKAGDSKAADAKPQAGKDGAAKSGGDGSDRGPPPKKGNGGGAAAA